MKELKEHQQMEYDEYEVVFDEGGWKMEYYNMAEQIKKE